MVKIKPNNADDALCFRKFQGFNIDCGLISSHREKGYTHREHSQHAEPMKRGYCIVIVPSSYLKRKSVCHVEWRLCGTKYLVFFFRETLAPSLRKAFVRDDNRYFGLDKQTDSHSNYWMYECCNSFAELYNTLNMKAHIFVQWKFFHNLKLSISLKRQDSWISWCFFI